MKPSWLLSFIALPHCGSTNVNIGCFSEQGLPARAGEVPMLAEIVHKASSWRQRGLPCKA